MITILVVITLAVALIATAWLAGPLVRESLDERRRLAVSRERWLAEQRVRLATQQTLAAMREAVRRGGGRR